MNEYLQPIPEFVTEVLDPIGIVISLLIAIPIFWTWWEIAFGARRRHRRWFKQAQENEGQRAGILIADLKSGKDIRATVEHFRQTHNKLKRIPTDLVFTLRHNQQLKPETMPEISRKLHDTASEITQAGIDQIHLFYAGPAIVGCLIGAEFANSQQVILYHHEGGQYINYGPLKHPN
ncbi:MAG: SAVED domain-containing protein [Thiotrichales bacterium]